MPLSTFLRIVAEEALRCESKMTLRLKHFSLRFQSPDVRHDAKGSSHINVLSTEVTDPLHLEITHL
jgi:hypothetical protein